jgi:CAI-1 autoinducer synthase
MHAHMSLWDGIAMAGIKPIAFRHNDVNSLKKLISKNGPGLVMVDSVYSTNGSVCPLKALVNAAFDLDCILLVDESHSLGTHGPQGRGMVVEHGLQNKVMFRTASLAKAFAGRAGLITAPAGFSDFFKFTSKPAIFSTALLPQEIAGLNSTLSLIIKADKKREQLRRNTSYIRRHLDSMGFNVDDSKSQIISLESGTEWNTILLRDELEKQGIFGSIFCAPATAKKRALMRFSINASLTPQELRQIVVACETIVTTLDVAQWRSTKRKKAPMNKSALIAC